MERLYILNPKRRSGCGMIDALKGAVYECGLGIDRQLNAVFLQMEGFSRALSSLELMTWSGFTLTEGR